MDIHADVPNYFRYVINVDKAGSAFDIYIKSTYVDHLDLSKKYGRTNNQILNLYSAIKYIQSNSLNNVLILLSNQDINFNIGLIEDLNIPKDCFLFIVTVPLRSTFRKRANVKIQNTPNNLNDKEFIIKVGTHFQYIKNKQKFFRTPSMPFPKYIGELKNLFNVLDVNLKRFEFFFYKNNYKFNCLWHAKPKTKFLVVVNQSAIDRNSVSLPFYQRWSWADDFDASTLIINDPTLYLDESLNGGWWLGKQKDDLVNDFISELKKLTNRMNIKNENIIFYGGSAGGFSSFQMSACLKGSMVIADIPQVNLLAYNQKKQMENILNICFETDDYKKYKKQNYKVDIVERFNKENNYPNFILLMNENDKHHIENHLLYLLSNYKKSSYFVVLLYDIYHMQRGGHVPLGRESTTFIINMAIQKLRYCQMSTLASDLVKYSSEKGTPLSIFNF